VKAELILSFPSVLDPELVVEYAGDGNRGISVMFVRSVEGNTVNVGYSVDEENLD
jgi:hypothetical protein